MLWEQDGALGKQFLSQNVRTWLLPLMGSLWQHRLGPFKEPLQDYANWAAGVCRDTPAPNLPETKCFDPDAAELETFKTYLLTPVLSGAFFSHQEIRQWGRVCGFSGSPTPRSQTFTALLRWAADRDQVVELLEHISASCQAQWQWREEQPWLQMQFDQAWQNKLQMTQKNLAKMAAAAGDLFLHAASETEHS